MFFFFKQKTAYEMRISDWSSDVCSSDLTHIFRLLKWGRILARHGALRGIESAPATPSGVKRLCRIARLGTIQPRVPDYAAAFQAKIGRATWRERGCQYG